MSPSRRADASELLLPLSPAGARGSILAHTSPRLATGLCSVTFRKLLAAEIIALVKRAGLDTITLRDRVAAVGR